MKKYLVIAKYWGKSKHPIITEHLSLEEAKRWINDHENYEFIAGFHYTNTHYLCKYSIIEVTKKLIEEKEFKKKLKLQ